MTEEVIEQLIPEEEIKEITGDVQWDTQKTLTFTGDNHYNRAIEHISVFRPVHVTIQSGTDQQGTPVTQITFQRVK